MKTNTEQIETALETLIEAIKTNTNCPADLRDRHFNNIMDTSNLLEEKLVEYGEKASIEEVESILEILTDQTATLPQTTELFYQSYQRYYEKPSREEEDYKTMRDKLENMKQTLGIILSEKKLKAANEKLNQIDWH